MATFKTEFQEIADELINDEFVDFAISVTLKQRSGGDYPGDTVTFSTEAGVMIPIEIDKSQFEQLDVQVGDKLLVAAAQDWTLVPSVNDIILLDSQDYNIVNVVPDAADAAYFIQVRR